MGSVWDVTLLCLFVTSRGVFCTGDGSLGVDVRRTAPTDPAEVLRVVTEGAFETDESGTGHLYCRQNTDNCFIACHGVGPDVSDVTLSKVVPGGGRVQVDSPLTRSEDLSYVFVEAFPQTDREGEENYVCDVTDNHGHHVTKDYRVTTYRSVYIIEAESGARWINETTLELKCAIWSPRRPRVLLGLTISSGHGEFSPDQLVAQGDNRYVASAAIHSDTLDRLDPHQMYLLNTYVTTGGTCSATTQIYDGGNHWVDAAHLYNNMLVPDRPNMER